MQWNEIKENWPAFVPAIMQRWPMTEENDLLTLDGDRAGLIDLLSRRHDLTRAEAEEQIAVWAEGAAPADAVMDPQMDNERIIASGAHIPAGEDVYSEDRDFGDDDMTERPMGKSD